MLDYVDNGLLRYLRYSLLLDPLYGGIGGFRDLPLRVDKVARARRIVKQKKLKGVGEI